MSDNTTVKPSGKVMFGVDYITIMSFMEIAGENEKYDKDKGGVVFSVIKLFLLEWDFSVTDIDEANRIFWEKVESNTLDKDINTVINRIILFLKDDKARQEKFLTEMAAIGQLDSTFLERERSLTVYFQEKFDLRPSELERIYKKGWDWAVALDFVGSQYIEYDKRKNVV